MSIHMRYWMAGAIALLLAVPASPADAQLNVIRRARQLKIEQDERRQNLEQQAEDLTEEGASSDSSGPSTKPAATQRSQPSNASETSPSAPVAPPSTATTETQPVQRSSVQPNQTTPPTGSNEVETIAELSPEEQFEKSQASWHLSENVCTLHWTADEFNRLFDRIDRELELEVCDR